MTPSYIALGSNLCAPQTQLGKAVIALQMIPETRLERVSSVYSSRAVGPGKQPDYLNAVVLVTTQLSPESLLDALQQIEQAQGRVRETRWGPRSLDLDILLYGNQQITSPRLTVPHPAMQQRDFVLYPLREISNTNLVLPDGTDIETLIQQCPDNGIMKTHHRLQDSQISQQD